jgi:hypothetical protein
MSLGRVSVRRWQALNLPSAKVRDEVPDRAAEASE